MRTTAYRQKTKFALDLGENVSLDKFDVFRGLSEADIDRIVEAAILRSLEGGKVLFHKGDRGTEVFLILKGMVHLVDEYDGHKKVLAELGPGEFFGEMSMIERAHIHSLHAIVKEPSHLLVLENHVLNRLIDDSLPKRFLKNIIGVLCRRIHANKNMYMRAKYCDKSSRDVKWQG
jgi:CRP/FNR family cyclic AMP-dependent transcriptional regulator